MKLPGIERKVRVLLDWTLDLFFKRDIALFQPRPTKLIKEMHLEKGDCVFHAGDPAQSLYIVKSGKLELSSAEGHVLRACTAGHQIGKDTLYNKKPWVFTATAVESTTLVAVSGEVFETVSRAGATVDEVFTVKPPEEKPAAPALPATSALPAKATAAPVKTTPAPVKTVARKRPPKV
jgi:NADH dehydrogenase